jgi:hypothetical protein
MMNAKPFSGRVLLCSFRISRCGTDPVNGRLDRSDPAEAASHGRPSKDPQAIEQLQSRPRKLNDFPLSKDVVA